MGEPVKYLVEIKCQALAPGQEAGIAAALAADFPVKACRANREGLTVELISPHPVAYRALQDLADLIEQTLAGQGIPLESGVIRQTLPEGREGAAPVVHALERLALAWPLLTGLLGRLAGRIAGLSRPVPVMYFYRGLNLDLMLAGKLNRTPQLNQN